MDSAKEEFAGSINSEGETSQSRFTDLCKVSFCLFFLFSFLEVPFVFLLHLSFLISALFFLFFCLI